MYTHHTQNFGEATLHHIINPKTGNGFSFAPETGGVLTDLFFKIEDEVHHIIDAYRTPESLAAFKYRKSANLMPFPNRLADGTYEFNGTTYQFPISENKPPKNNSVHGFRTPEAMQVSDIALYEDSASVTLAYDYNGNRPYYPFPFRFEQKLTISDKNQSLDISVSFENKGTTNMPIAYGWHPYFHFGSFPQHSTTPSDINNIHLQLPYCKKVLCDSRQIPTGKTGKYTVFDTASVFGIQEFDDCFEVENKGDKVYFLMKSEMRYVQLWMETGENKFNYFQIYTPTHRKSFAIEPMTCNINGFQNGDGLIDLEIGEKTSMNFGINVKYIGHEERIII